LGRNSLQNQEFNYLKNTDFKIFITLVVDSKIGVSKNLKIICFEISKFKTSKINILKVITLFTMGSMVIICVTPAIALALDTVLTLATTVQHITCQLGCNADSSRKCNTLSWLPW
jgi:hypothetical protein